VISRRRELGGGTILGLGPSVGCMLGASGSGVIETLESLGDVVGHREIHGAINIIPSESDTKIQIAGPISGDLIFGLEGIAKMFGMFATNVFDTKIINDEAKGNRACNMAEQTRGVFCLNVTMLGKVGNKLVVGNSASLGEAIHAAADFNVDVIIVDKGRQVVVIKNGLGDIADVDPHVLIMRHGRVEIKILDIHCHEFGIGCGHDAVEDNFGS